VGSNPIARSNAQNVRPEATPSRGASAPVIARSQRVRPEAATYTRAVGCDPFTFGHPEKARINKRIGALTKRLLGADVIMTGKRREKGQPSRTEKSLILSYTLLTKGSRRRL
jgi:hypothetical protein